MTRPIPRTLAISDRRLLPDAGAPAGLGGFVAWVAACRRAGVGAIQIREKDLGDRRLLEWTRAAVGEASREPRGGQGLLVLVNGRLDIAMAAGAAGVHLPTTGLDASLLRRRFGRRWLIGCSTHHPDEVAEARRRGADYVTFGPIFPTPSKRGLGEPPGLAGLRRATRHGLPVLALGGLGVEHVGAVAEAAAYGVAAIRAFHAPDTRRELVAACRRAWSGSQTPPHPL